MTIRVLHVIDSLDLGGAQTILLELFKTFNDDRFHLSLAALHGPGTFSNDFKDIGHPPRHLAKSRFSPLLIPRLRALIRREKIDMVHAHLVPSCFVCETMRRYLQIPQLISHVHYPYREHPGFHGYQNLLEKRIYRNTDTILSCSQYAAQNIDRKPPFHVLFNGVDPTRFSPASAEQRESARRSLDLPSDAFVVGATGRVAKVKNHALLCRSMASLKDDIPTIRVIVVGSGPEEHNVRQAAQRMGVADRLTIPGYRSDVQNCLAALDVFAFPSTAEGLPLSLVEAMACGLPCVVADFPGASEIVRQEENALIFQRGDSAGLSRQIRRFHDRPEFAAECGARARDHVLNHFTMRHTADNLAHIYTVLAGASHLETPNNSR